MAERIADRMMKDFMKDEPGAPEIVDRSTFQAELDALRVREKAHTKEGDAIAAARRRLPMVGGEGGTPATLRQSNARAAPGLRRRSASYHIFILAGSPTPLFAKAPTKKVPGTATSWAGRCPGTRPRARSTPSWLDAE